VSVVRAANILNRAYFSDTQLRQMLANLKRSLTAGGVLMVCRTGEGNRTAGTLFRLTDEGEFSVVERLNEGSELEDLVTSLGTAADRLLDRKMPATTNDKHE
jgi:hypothetical protein